MDDTANFRSSPLLSILECSADGIAIVESISARLLYANTTLCNWLRIPDGATVLEIVLSDVLEVCVDAPPRKAAGMQLLENSEGAPIAARLLVPGPVAKPVEVRVCRIPGERKELYGVLLSAAKPDPAGAVDLELSRRDPLTGLRDRAFLATRLAELLASDRAADQRFAVLFVDLDNFKQVNDAFGHLVGDSVLREVAHRLTCSVRSHDHVVRFGGDEFVVLAEQLTASGDIDSIIRRIHGVLESPIALPEGAIALTLSIGVAEASAQYRSPEDLLAAADRAMYASKRATT